MSQDGTGIDIKGMDIKMENLEGGGENYDKNDFSDWDKLSEVKFRAGTKEGREVGGNAINAPSKEEIRFSKVEETDISAEANNKQFFTPESVKRTYEFALKDYINGLYEEDGPGGKERDPADYTWSSALDAVLGSEAQDALIREHAATRQITMTEEIAKRFSEAISQFKYAEQLLNDPFLENLKAEQLAGRYDPNTDPENQNNTNVLHLIWGMNRTFSVSPAARGLFRDADYLKRTYGEDFLKNEVILNEAIDAGQTSTHELLNDPFLREKHIKYEFHETENHTEAEAAIWGADGNRFYDSWQLNKYLEEKRDENREIFKDAGAGETEKITGEALNAISDAQLEKIIRAYEKDTKQGDAMLISALLPVVGLSSNPPKIAYNESEHGELGFYRRSTHVLNIAPRDDQESRADKKGFLSGISGVFRGLSLKGSSSPDAIKTSLNQDGFSRINVVAHEMWHAGQFAGENIPEERREKYLLNNKYYVKGTNNYKGYREQLLEREAFMFGNNMEKRVKKLFNFSDQRSFEEIKRDEENADGGVIYYRG